MDHEAQRFVQKRERLFRRIQAQQNSMLEDHKIFNGNFQFKGKPMQEYIQEQLDQLGQYRVLIEEATQKDPERMRKELDLIKQAKSTERAANAMWQRVARLSEKRKLVNAAPDGLDSEAKNDSQIKMSNPDELIEGTPNASPDGRRVMSPEEKKMRDSHLSIQKGQEVGQVTQEQLQVINRSALKNPIDAAYGTMDSVAMERLQNAPLLDTLSEPGKAGGDKVLLEQPNGGVLQTQGGEINN